MDESLRDRYRRILHERTEGQEKSPRNRKKSFWDKIDPFSGLGEIVESAINLFGSPIESFICPNCLKSIIVKEFYFSCPFCDEQYNLESDSAEDSRAVKDFFKSKIREEALFVKCVKCNSKIRYVECYHCKKPIDLFAPYNEKELEAKRYE